MRACVRVCDTQRQFPFGSRFFFLFRVIVVGVFLRRVRVDRVLVCAKRLLVRACFKKIADLPTWIG